MKLLFIYLVGLLLSCVVPSQAKWRLAWSDEFNTLDTTKWNLRNQPGNFGNGEKQWYHPSQISVSNGYLSIKAERSTAYTDLSYISGRMDTQDKAAFTYGRYEIRAKMAGGKGMWPAMWLLSQNRCWGSGAEIDLAEFRGSYPKNIGNYYHFGSQCCKGFSNCISSKGAEHALTVDLTKNYYTYALEWWPGNMTWFINDYVVESYKTSSLGITQDPTPHYWVINSAVGGGYPGYPDSTTVFPNYHSVDYVRNYVWRPTCSGVTCSNRGCCNPTTVLCQCDAGYSGANCEQDLSAVSKVFDDTNSLDNIPNGWGNDYTLYLTKNAAVSGTSLKLSLTNAGCPGSCGNKRYSSGGWESIPRYAYGLFTFTGRPSKVSGTGLSFTIAGENTKLEQIGFTFQGRNSTNVELWTWSGGWPYKQADIKLSFDASLKNHDYAVSWGADKTIWYVDNVAVFQSTVVRLNATRLGPGAYYTAQPDWYGPFSYTDASAAYISNFNWRVAPSKAVCN